MNFAYEAMNSLGQPVKGYVEAVNSDEAIAKVRAMGNFPTKLKEQKEGVTLKEAFEGITPKAKREPVSLKAQFIVSLIAVFLIGVCVGAAIGVAI